MLVSRDGLALDERDAVGALGEDAVLGDGGQQLPLPRPLQRAGLVRDDLGAAVVGHHCNEKTIVKSDGFQFTRWSLRIWTGKAVDSTLK